MINRLFVVYYFQRASEICRFQPSAQVKCEEANICISPSVFRGQRSGAEYRVIMSCQTSLMQLLFGHIPDSNPGQPGLRGLWVTCDIISAPSCHNLSWYTHLRLCPAGERHLWVNLQMRKGAKMSFKRNTRASDVIFLTPTGSTKEIILSLWCSYQYFMGAHHLCLWLITLYRDLFPILL